MPSPIPPSPQPTPHPVRAVLAARRITVKQLAAAIGGDVSHTSAVIFKRTSASPAFRRRVSEALGLDESELFDHGTLRRSFEPVADAASKPNGGAKRRD